MPRIVHCTFSALYPRARLTPGRYCFRQQAALFHLGGSAGYRRQAPVTRSKVRAKFVAQPP